MLQENHSNTHQPQIKGDQVPAASLGLLELRQARTLPHALSHSHPVHSDTPQGVPVTLLCCQNSHPWPAHTAFSLQIHPQLDTRAPRVTGWATLANS